MKLDIIASYPTMEELQYFLGQKYEQPVRIIQEMQMTMIEQWHVRGTKKWIPECWKYRIVRKNGLYHYGISKEETDV